MAFRRQKQEKLYLDEAPEPRRRPAASYPVAPSQAPSLEYAAPSMQPPPLTPPVANLPMILPQDSDRHSPWRRDVRFAVLLVAVVLGLNLGLYYVFNHPLGSAPERMTMALEQTGYDYKTLSLEERVLTYSNVPSQGMAIPHTPRPALYPSVAK